MAKTTAEAFAEATALEGPLAVKLAHYAEALRDVAPSIAGAYDGLVARLRAGQVAAGAPKVGERLPPFLLSDERGHLVHSDALFTSRASVLSFNRGHWCPFCRLEVSSLAAVSGRITAQGAQIVSIAPEPAPFLRKLQEDCGAPFTFLSDIDNSYALQLGLVMAVGEELRALMLARGLDLARFQGNEHWFLPVPATFVIDAGGTVRARWIDPDFRTRMATEDILSALAP